MKKYQSHDVNFRGTIERVTYTTTTPDGKPFTKYANVYLPYGYYAQDKSKRYNVLYVMHGGGGSPDAWLDCCKVKNMLDYSIDQGEVSPLIVVFPTYYKSQISRIGPAIAEVERTKVLQYLPEETDELLPAIEGRYNTYSTGTTAAELRAAREHRGFGGFSMGSCTTWYNFLCKLPYFGTFIPLSGDCWEFGVKGGMLHAKETAHKMYQTAKETGLPFQIYAATGTQDAAYEAMTPQIEAMKQYPDVFQFHDDPAQGNLHYLVAEGETHRYDAVCDYLYTYLPFLFQ